MSIADRLITNGWVKGQMMNLDGEVCLSGAIALEAGYYCYQGEFLRPNSDKEQERWKAGMSLAECFIPEGDGWCFVMRDGTPRRDIPAFNDFPLTTYDDVLRVAKQTDEIIDALKGMRDE